MCIHAHMLPHAAGPFQHRALLLFDGHILHSRWPDSQSDRLMAYGPRIRAPTTIGLGPLGRTLHPKTQPFSGPANVNPKTGADTYPKPSVQHIRPKRLQILI